MEFACVCHKTFEVKGADTILPEHEDQDGEICTGSNLSVKDICQTEEAITCPLGLDDSHCATCVPQPCRNEDDD